MYRVIILCFLFISGLAYAQPTSKYTSKYSDFYKAEDLFEKEQFGSARSLFRVFITENNDKNDPMYIKAMYYEASSALELFHNDAIKLLEDFNRNYPENIYKNQVYFKIGKYYFQKKEDKETIAWLSKINKFDLDTADRAEFNYKLGQAYLNVGELEKAKLNFVDVKDGNSAYAGPALYYFSHISYQQKHYAIALEGFEKLKDDARFSKIVPYYITQIYYLLGDYKKVTTLAKSLEDEESKPSNFGDMNQLIGDAYYRTNQYDEAAVYLEKYNKKHETNRDENYQLGYAFFKSGNYTKAINEFDKVTKEQDSLSQITYYNIAECYLRNNNLIGARNAFDRASRLPFNPKIQEDGLYNFAVLSYKVDINPYNEAVIALQEYIEKYPKSDRIDEVYNCLMSVYTTTHRFQDALNSLEKSQVNDVRLKAAYQIVAFNLAVEKFQNAKYDEAISTLQLVRKYPIDDKLVNQSFYWTGDAYYRMKNYDKAIEYFESFVKNPIETISNLRNDAYYNLGYCYLNKKQFGEEEAAFVNYISNETKNKEKIFDALLRLGDVCYVVRKNNDAVKYYEQAIKFNNPQKDHAYYYMALTYGLEQNGIMKKIKALKDLTNDFPRSPYYLTSLYEIALSYRSIKEEDFAISYFNKIINEFPTSNYIVPSKLNIGDAYLSARKYDKAELYFKQLLKEYPNDNDVCETCVGGLSKIYTAQKKIDQISTLSVYPCAKEIENQIEDTYYNQAIEPYLDQDTNYQASIQNMTAYLDKFPNGKYAPELTGYLANCYIATSQQENAIKTYEKLLAFPKNGQSENAASIVSKYYYNNGDYEKAARYYKMLDELSVNVGTRYQSSIGIMRTSYLQKNYGDAANAAQRVLTSSLITKEVQQEANYMLGVSNYMTKNYSQAIEPLEYVVKNAKNSTANESKFYLAQIDFEDNKLDKTENHIRELLKIKPAYDYWIAKGLMLQTKVYMKKKDLFNAEQTLSSVIDNYKQTDDGIREEADALWAELMQLKNMPKETNEKKSDNFIEMDGNGK
jgi:tetratricopeptide (TPR) repeat protein